ncbi:cation efflux protein [Suhomyces tanzawaensis NRRL Y-17324]|uniref:Cation efflux protein n=1 Tax=Suhomyces tanzawaensis NRRL Y-17324 TaxID=984487 RepID=A0A1E4SEX6_9ASCO|nr:cation efflux protein [Suhomyces tanzawaensis NRRL Y-17324]ODV78089.1 cation efflux protein [Suhomyces tanzawaensis NRRL Y-17324]
MNGKELRIGSLLVLDTVFFLLEAIVGYSVHSLALVADSFHMLNDIISLIIALWAVRVKNTKPADGKYTYGWQRAEILGALINAVFLLALCFTIIIEAIQRFFEPAEISSPKLVLVVGCAGLASNFVGLVLFHEHGHSHGGGSGHGHGHSHSDPDPEASVGQSSLYQSSHNNSSTDVADYLPDSVVERYNEDSPLLHKHDHSHSEPHPESKPKKKKSMNMEGVFLHVFGDALGNVGVIITALFIWKTDYSWRFLTDPIVSLVITVIIFSSALPLCRKSSKILLQATPPNINPQHILESILKLASVKSVHDFHVWNLNEDILIASLHLELSESSEPNASTLFDQSSFLKVVGEVREVLHRFGIHSATIQPEFSTAADRVLNRKASAYGQSSKLNCVVDDYSNCDTDQCK